jgi:hypothetical protein
MFRRKCGQQHLITELTRMERTKRILRCSMRRKRGDIELVKSKLEKGADIYARTAHFETPAAYQGNVEIVGLLLQRGAEVDSGDSIGCSTIQHGTDTSRSCVCLSNMA